MTQKFCDLHLHTICSDGSDTPTELVKRAKAMGMSAIALTDHNCLGGLEEFEKACIECGMEYAKGIEITTEHHGREVHLNALFLTDDAICKIADFLAEIRAVKQRCNREFVERLAADGYNVSWDEIVASSANKDNINRAIIGLFLVQKGILPSVKEGFKTILSEKAGYYRPGKRPETLDTVKFLSELGAVSVIAHPYFSLEPQEATELLTEAKACGLVGFETHYTLYDQGTHELACRVAKDLGLLPSGGSDYHGKAKPDVEIGCAMVPYEFFVALKSKANI